LGVREEKPLLRIAAITLGHLRMTVEDQEVIDALLTIAASVFPYDSDTRETPETNMVNLKSAIENILELMQGDTR
jgi:hypothetical protein